MKVTRMRTIFTIALLIFPYAASRIDGAMIRLKRGTTVSSAVVTLGDVADILDPDPQIVERLKAVTLLPAPAPGKQLRVAFATIRSRLGAQGFNLLHLEFSGRSVVTVSTLGKPQPDILQASLKSSPRMKVSSWQIKRAEQLLAAALQSYLQRQRQVLSSFTVEVRVDQSDVAKILSGQSSGYEIRGGHPSWNAPQTMTVRFLDRRERLHTVNVMCLIREHPFVPTVKYNVPRGHVLQRADIVMEQIDRGEQRFPSLPEVLGRETKRTIRQGQPVRAEDIREIPLVRSNDIVTVYSRAGGITVRRQLKSRGNGSMGERITLVSLDGRERIEATVTGYHEAEVVGSNPPASVQQAAYTGRIQFRPSPQSQQNRQPPTRRTTPNPIRVNSASALGRFRPIRPRAATAQSEFKFSGR